jgi:hypothetical protein
MRPAEQSTIVTVPTMLGRSDGFFDMAVLLGSGLGVWWLMLKGAAVWWFVPLLVIVVILTLTGEPAGDIPFVGAIASGLRAKLGMRRASEWALAWLHYVRVRVLPDMRTQWQYSRLRSRIRTWSNSPRLRTWSSALRNSRPARLSMPFSLSSVLVRMRRNGSAAPASVAHESL